MAVPIKLHHDGISDIDPLDVLVDLERHAGLRVADGQRRAIPEPGNGTTLEYQIWNGKPYAIGKLATRVCIIDGVPVPVTVTYTNNTVDDSTAPPIFMRRELNLGEKEFAYLFEGLPEKTDK